MWNLIKTETIYQRNIFLIFAALIPFIIMYELLPEKVSHNFLYFFLIFMITNSLGSKMLKENRVTYCILLPLSTRKVAAGRLLIVIIEPFLIAVFLFLAIFLFVNLSYLFPVVIFGLSMILHCLFFILRDLDYTYLKKYKNLLYFSSAMMFLILFSTFFLFSYTMYFNITAPGGGKFNEIIKYSGKMISFIFSGRGCIFVYSITLILSLLSIETFTRKKSYMSFVKSKA